MDKIKGFHLKVFLKHFWELVPGVKEDDDEKVASSVFTFKFFKKRQFFQKKGDIPEYIGFITKGAARSYYLGDDGKEYTTCFPIEGNWIGEPESYFHKTPAELNIEFLDDTDILMLNKSTFDKVNSENDRFEKYFRMYFQGAAMHYANRIKLDLHAPAKDKYLNFKIRNPEIIKLVPQKLIASYLGMTAEFLSKIKKELGE
jgi:CRP/FNR family transcriptional regulator, cyclic AMP receptor protein